MAKAISLLFALGLLKFESKHQLWRGLKKLVSVTWNIGHSEHIMRLSAFFFFFFGPEAQLGL
jgi:hypothetical protein